MPRAMLEDHESPVSTWNICPTIHPPTPSLVNTTSLSEHVLPHTRTPRVVAESVVPVTLMATHRTALHAAQRKRKLSDCWLRHPMLTPHAALIQARAQAREREQERGGGGGRVFVVEDLDADDGVDAGDHAEHEEGVGHRDHRARERRDDLSQRLQLLEQLHDLRARTHTHVPTHPHTRAHVSCSVAGSLSVAHACIAVCCTRV
eukprot:3184378-Rhodomonas_salina.2